MAEADDVAAPPELIAGRYRKDGLLGQGGMSWVYYGYDERLDRRVAIKELKPPAHVPAGHDSPEASMVHEELERGQNRFLREIRTMARLEIPGVPAVYDTGVERPDDGPAVLWLVMQLLRGSTLQAVIDETDYENDPLDVASAAAIVAQIAAVLADVHRVDIVHRDIKPLNIMVTDSGLVKVLDFGISILLGAGALPRLTQVGTTVGTPRYMSPEQWQGGPVTAASDIYSLGCILTELLTGDPPFPVPEDKLRRAHEAGQAPAPSTSRPGLPQDLDMLVGSMLAKDPEARPSAVRVYDALLPFIITLDSPNGSPVTAARPSVFPSAGAGRDPVRPFRAPLLAPVHDPAATAEESVPLTSAEAGLLLQTAASYLDADRPADAVQILTDGIARTRQDPGLQLHLRHILGGALLAAGRYTMAAAEFESVGRVLLERAHRRPNDPDVLDCAYQAGVAYAETGKITEALSQLRFYVENAKDDADPGQVLQVLQARFIIAQLRAADGRPDQALADLRAIRPAFVSVYGADSTQVRNLDKQADRLNRATRTTPPPR